MDTSQATQPQAQSGQGQDINVELNAGLAAPQTAPVTPATVTPTPNAALPAQPSGVPMISPDNTDARIIPSEHQDSASQAGWQPAVKVVHPTTGDARWIPTSQADAATQAGYQRSDVPVALTSKPGEQFQGLGSALWDRAKGLVTGVGVQGAAKDFYEHATEVPRLYRAYTEARQKGADITTAISAANDEAKKFNEAHDTIKNLAEEYEKNPNKALWGNIIDMALMGVVGKAAAPAAEEEAAVGATAKEAPTHVFDAATEKLTPIESAVSKAVAKSGLPEGQAASVAPTGEGIQPALQQGIRDTMSRVAKENGVAAPTAPSIRDVVKETADNIYAKSKSQFSVLDEATGGNVSRFDEQIRNVNRALQNVTDDAEEAKLLARKANLETSQEGAFEEAKAKGVDPKLVDDAKANYKKAQALYDVDNHVKMSTSGTRPNIGKPGGQTPEIVDPKKLSSRLNKVYDSGRLQDAAGEDNAQALLTRADNAQVAGQQIKEFVPTSPTGQKAMQNILTPNTKGKLIGSGANTDFLKSYRDFDALTPEEQTAHFGKDVGQARNYLKTQARNQLIKTWGKRIGIGVGLGVVAKETGLTSALIHTLLE